MSTGYPVLTTLFDLYQQSRTCLLFTETYQTNLSRLLWMNGVLVKLDRQIATLRPTLNRGRNVDAVDELAQQEFYREQAAVLVQRSSDMLYLLDEMSGEMARIYLINGVWEGVAPARLSTVFDLMRQQLEHEESTMAILEYLPRGLFEGAPAEMTRR